MDPTAIGEQIDRILRSQSLATKSQLRKLLEVLGKNAAAQVPLTTEAVINELWPTETKTKQAKDVATEMNRLRRAVESYYSLEGETDRLIIYFPKRAPGGNGHQETRWIDATFRKPSEAHAPAQPQAPKKAESSKLQPSAQAETHRGLKRVALLVMACAVLALVAGIFIFKRGMDRQPYSARVDGTVLRILDAQGTELWTKNFPQGFRTDWHYRRDTGLPVWLEDLEGQGHVSVLFAYSPAAGQQLHSSTLICYSDRGKEKWRWTPGRNLPELNGSPAVFLTEDLAVLKATAKRPARIVVASIDPWWPSQIAILDSNGKVVSEYWHSGHSAYSTLAELDGAGEQIILTGTANGYDHQATLVVLDPDRVSGASTEVQPEFQIHGMGAGQEKLRLLFPRSDFNKAALFTYNDAIEPEVRDGKLQLAVQECPAPNGCPVLYQFDMNSHLIAAYAGGDEFRNAHNLFYQTAKAPTPLAPKNKRHSQESDAWPDVARNSFLWPKNMTPQPPLRRGGAVTVTQTAYGPTDTRRASPVLSGSTTKRHRTASTGRTHSTGYRRPLTLTYHRPPSTTADRPTMTEMLVSSRTNFCS
jgi:hypothetical protein